VRVCSPLIVEARKMDQTEQLTIKQTSTGYWSVQRGSVHLAGAPTRRGAEAERELLRRLSTSAPRRPRRRPRAYARNS
jgi:hypothetical protein